MASNQLALWHGWQLVKNVQFYKCEDGGDDGKGKPWVHFHNAWGLTVGKETLGTPSCRNFVRSYFTLNTLISTKVFTIICSPFRGLSVHGIIVLDSCLGAELWLPNRRHYVRRRKKLLGTLVNLFSKLRRNLKFLSKFHQNEIRRMLTLLCDGLSGITREVWVGIGAQDGKSVLRL